MPRMTPEREAQYALDFGVARSDLPEASQLAYDRLVEQRAHAPPPAPVLAAGTGTGEEARPPPRYSRAELYAAIAVDVTALAAAAGLYLVIAVTDIASWPANRMLISGRDFALLFVGVWLLSVYTLLSNGLLYGWLLLLPSGQVPGPGQMLRAMYWGARRRPSWGRLPASMRRPPAWMWLLLAAAAAGSAAVVAGSLRAGAYKSGLRVLPGPRYEVSTIALNNFAWTQVSHATYQAYAADYLRLDCVLTPVLFLLIANIGYAVFLRRELLRRGPAGQPSPAS
jgi:hypothetical protein